jgi:hypothetical protein
MKKEEAVPILWHPEMSKEKISTEKRARVDLFKAKRAFIFLQADQSSK